MRGVIDALFSAGRLGRFYCSLGLTAESWWLRFMPFSIGRNLRRRCYRLPAALLCTHPVRELVRQLSRKLGCQRLTRSEVGWASVDAVYHSLDRFVARKLPGNGISAVYCYEDGALATFTRAKELGVLRVYDLPIAYWETLRRLIAEERERLPEWAGTLGGGLSDSQAKLDRKTRELELADVVMVPSQFVADSLPEWARRAKRVVVSPFGSPEAADAAGKAGSEKAETGNWKAEGSESRNSDSQTQLSAVCPSPPQGAPAPAIPSGQILGDLPSPPHGSVSSQLSAKSPLRVLFAGSMGQRKGLGDLMAAIRLLNRADVELICMGSLQAPMEFYEKQCPGFTHEKGRPHAEVLELMRSCDVFCLPSIVEGRALVMQEAMSQGLPIIITPNTGGEDLVEPNRKAESGKLKAEDGKAGSEKAETGRSAERGDGQPLAVDPAGMADSGAQRAEAGTKLKAEVGKAESGKLKAESSDSQKSDIFQLSAFRSQVSPSPQVSAFSFQLSGPRYGRGPTGFLVPIRSPEAIAEAIAWCADHRDELPAMGRAAQAKAAEYTWEAYGNRIVDAISAAAAAKLKAETGKLKAEDGKADGGGSRRW